MSPEYALQGQFSMKSDVYSFGVLVLEIISGKKNSNVYQMDETSTAGNLVNNVSIKDLNNLTYYKHYDKGFLIYSFCIRLGGFGETGHHWNCWIHQLEGIIKVMKSLDASILRSYVFKTIQKTVQCYQLSS